MEQLEETNTVRRFYLLLTKDFDFQTLARKTRSKNLRSVDSLMKIPGLSATIIHHNKVSVLLVGLIVRLGTPRKFVDFLSTFYGSFSDFNFFRKSSFSKKNLVFMGRY